MPPFSSVGISVTSRDDIALIVKARQRLQHERGRVNVLGARGQVKIETACGKVNFTSPSVPRSAKAAGAKVNAQAAPRRAVFSFIDTLLVDCALFGLNDTG